MMVRSSHNKTSINVILIFFGTMAKLADAKDVRGQTRPLITIFG